MENIDKEIFSFNDFFNTNSDLEKEFKDFIHEIKEDKKIETVEKITESVITEEEEEILIEEVIQEDNYYPVYKDKIEDFKFEIYLEGDAKLSNTQARLILESEEWSIIFNGSIDRKGICTIPMKKLSILEENTIGKIKVEVISDNTVFIPWEDEFKVKLSKKISIKMNEKVIQKKPEPQKTGVKINLKK